MNSEEYGSYRGVFMDGLRNTRYTTQCSQIPLRDLNPKAAKSVALVTARPRQTTCNACHETQCEEAARHRHQLHVTDFLHIM
jgi:hypothetical protein